MFIFLFVSIYECSNIKKIIRIDFFYSYRFYSNRIIRMFIPPRYTRKYLTKNERERINLETITMIQDSNQFPKNRQKQQTPDKHQNKSSVSPMPLKKTNEDLQNDSENPDQVNENNTESIDQDNVEINKLTDNPVKTPLPQLEEEEETNIRYFTRFQAKKRQSCLLCLSVEHHYNCLLN